MPMYQYRCPACRANLERYHSVTDEAGRLDLPTCPNCYILMKRVFSFSAAPVFEGYFDLGVGSYVTSKADLDEKCRIKSEENYARNGIPSDIRAYDRNELTAEDLGVTDEGMGATHDRAVEEGRIDPAGKIVF